MKKSIEGDPSTKAGNDPHAESGLSSVQPEPSVMNLRNVSSEPGTWWPSEELFYWKIERTVRQIISKD